MLKEDVTGHGVFRSPNAVTNELGKKYYSDKIAEMKLPNGEKEGYTTWGSYFSPGLGANAYADYGMQDVKINFTEITGPGSVALFKQSISGEPIAILNDDRIYLETGTSLDINSPDHRHFQWVFSKPGKYVFTAHAEATSTDGGVITSPEVKYTWLIGEIPAASAEDNASATTPDTSQPDTTDDTKPATPQPSKPETSTKPDTGKSKKDPNTGKKENTEKISKMRKSCQSSSIKTRSHKAAKSHSLPAVSHQESRLLSLYIQHR
ncbi:choice-of-anchor M domain-containing protein [Arcanobacterium hippocoleae]|uniref:choice-of-anchor M domain-containing protein n=1 Tax=Arcanobacterium hippocoleae TaxID=149017 RepID=UPI003341B087